MSFAMALVRVTGRSASRLSWLQKGTIVPLFHARGTIPRDRDLLNVRRRAVRANFGSCRRASLYTSSGPHARRHFVNRRASCRSCSVMARRRLAGRGCFRATWAAGCLRAFFLKNRTRWLAAVFKGTSRLPSTTRFVGVGLAEMTFWSVFHVVECVGFMSAHTLPHLSRQCVSKSFLRSWVAARICCR